MLVPTKRWQEEIPQTSSCVPAVPHGHQGLKQRVPGEGAEAEAEGSRKRFMGLNVPAWSKAISFGLLPFPCGGLSSPAGTI